MQVIQDSQDVNCRVERAKVRLESWTESVHLPLFNKLTVTSGKKDLIGQSACGIYWVIKCYVFLYFASFSGPLLCQWPFMMLEMRIYYAAFSKLT